MAKAPFPALENKGKRLPTLEEYACNLLPLDFEIDNSGVNQFGAVSDTNPESVAVVQISPRHFRFMPGPEFCPRLYCIGGKTDIMSLAFHRFIEIGSPYGMEIGLIPHHPRGIDAAVIELESVGYKVIEAMHRIDPSAFTAALDDWNSRAPEFLAKMKIRGCSDHF